MSSASDYPTSLAVANYHRAAAAAIIEVDRVREALRDLPRVSPQLLAVAQLRQAHPTASYAELARIDGTLTRDQVRSRIRHLLHVAKKHRQADAA